MEPRLGRKAIRKAFNNPAESFAGASVSRGAAPTAQKEGKKKEIEKQFSVGD
jgi:hypothetical protein